MTFASGFLLVSGIFIPPVSDVGVCAFIMLTMANLAYLSIWCRDFSEDTILERFGAFLGTVPFSRTKPGFTHFTVRALEPSEWPVLEQDLRAAPFDAAGIIELAKDQLHNDCSYEVECAWDLWAWDAATDRWKLDPQPLELFCRGEEYDNAFWRENGHVEVNLGFEHIFTGQAGLLTGENVPGDSPEQARFLEAMTWPENLIIYREKTQENIRKLMDWVQRIEKAVPVARVRLWSESDENLEARLDEILAIN
jgi:hypothetical protein